MSKTVAQSTPTTMRAVIYVRISKDRDTSSIRTQEAECRKYCEQHGITVIDVCEDRGKSAFDQTVKRPGFVKAMQYVESGAANVIIVWKLDRLIRNAKEFKRVWLRIDDAHAQLVSATETYVNTTEILIREILLAIMSIMAELESRTKSDRISVWHDDRMRDGAIPNGPVPFGYMKVTNEKGTTYVPHTEHAKMIRKAADDVLTGTTSIRAIARQWNDAGISSSQGKAWSHHGVKHVLTNPTTAGLRVIDDEQIKGTWKSILDMPTWVAVCVMLNDPERTSAPTPNGRKWLLSSLVTCGRDGCDGTLRAKPHGQGPRYACRTCGMSMDAGQMDAFVSKITLDLLDQDAWEEMRARGQMADNTRVDELTARLNAQRERYLDGRIDDDEWDSIRDGINARIADIETADVVELPDVANVREAWPTLNVEGKRLVLVAAWERMTLNPIAPGCSGTARIHMQ